MVARLMPHLRCCGWTTGSRPIRCRGGRRSAACARPGGRGCRSRCSRGRRRRASPSVVAVRVSGMSDTSNHDPSGSSPTALTVSETPSTAIEPLSTTSGACAASSEKRMTRQASPGRISSTCAVPSMWPCTMWPPSRSPTWAARSRFTSSPSAAPSSVDIASVCAITSAVKPSASDLDDREAHARDRDRVAVLHARDRERAAHGEARGVVGPLDARDGADAPR